MPLTVSRDVPVPRPASAAADATWSLVARARGGDEGAFTALVVALHPTVYRWALTLAADGDDADDVAQEAMVLMHRHLAQFEGDAPLEAWLYRIVRRAAGQRARTARRRAGLAAQPKARPDRDVYLTDPGARVDRERAAAHVADAFRRLPARQREIFDLVDLQGYDSQEVASMIGIKATTVRANLLKARVAVRAHLIARHPAAAEVVR